jgi:hypothetical protein
MLIIRYQIDGWDAHIDTSTMKPVKTVLTPYLLK